MGTTVGIAPVSLLTQRPSKPTEKEVAQPEKVLMPSTLVRASTLLVLLTTLIPSLSSRKSRTDVLLCSPCSDSTSRPSSPERVQLPTGRTTLPTHGPSTVSLRSSPPSSPLTKCSWLSSECNSCF